MRRLGEAVSELQDGHSYVIYDTSPSATERIGYRNVNPATGQVMQATTIADTDPYYVWTLERVGTTGNRFRVKNEMTGKYISVLTQSGAIYVADAGDTFTFTHHDGDVWEVRGTNNQYWDGVAGSFTGWHTYGHPYKFYEYYAQPYFLVTVEYVSDQGEQLAASTTALVKAGDAYTPVAPSFDGLTLQTLENADALEAVAANVTARLVYADPSTSLGSPLMVNGQWRVVFDLQGRSVARPRTSGIYIVNGAKVLVR